MTKITVESEKPMEIITLEEYIKLQQVHSYSATITTQRLTNLDGLTLEEIEREWIKRALSHFDGNRRQTAQYLGIAERTLYRKN